MITKRVQTYSIGDTADMAGATKKQIRYWEIRGFIPKADRMHLGDRSFRRFTLNQVDLISRIKDYLDEGFNLSAAAEKAKADNLVQRIDFRPGGIG